MRRVFIIGAHWMKDPVIERMKVLLTCNTKRFD